MEIEHYRKFQEYRARGLKKQATTSVTAFIQSFENDKEVRKWVWEFLKSLEIHRSGKIRHEIYRDLVYPTLKQGYESNDFASTFWLGKLSQNLYQARDLHKDLGWITDQQLFRKCYEIDSGNDELRQALLEGTVQWLRYCEHEWPRGILYGADGASLEECRDILSEVDFAKELDRQNRYESFFTQFLGKLEQYEARLKAGQPRGGKI